MSGNPEAPVAVSAEGHAALVLFESLIHELVATAVITAQQAVNIAEIARDAQAAVSEEGRLPDPAMNEAVSILGGLAATFSRI